MTGCSTFGSIAMLQEHAGATISVTKRATRPTRTVDCALVFVWVWVGVLETVFPPRGTWVQRVQPSVYWDCRQIVSDYNKVGIVHQIVRSMQFIYTVYLHCITLCVCVRGILVLFLIPFCHFRFWGGRGFAGLWAGQVFFPRMS